MRLSSILRRTAPSFLAALLAASVLLGTPDSAAGEILLAASGSETFAQYCAACHGPSGEGMVGPSLQESTLSKSQIVNQVTSGGASMPSFQDILTAEEIEAVAAHAKSLQVTATTTAATTTSTTTTTTTTTPPTTTTTPTTTTSTTTVPTTTTSTTTTPPTSSSSSTTTGPPAAIADPIPPDADAASSRAGGAGRSLVSLLGGLVIAGAALWLWRGRLQ